MAKSAPKASPAKRLRALINAPDILVLPGVFDGFSTRLVEKMGYTAAFITGSGVSESRMGQPDVGLMGLEENVAAARAIAACSNLLLLAVHQPHNGVYVYNPPLDHRVVAGSQLIVMGDPDGVENLREKAKASSVAV